MKNASTAFGSLIPRWHAGRSWLWQSAGVLAAFQYFLHMARDNNGLWYQGDSSIHGTNGLFWSDFLSNLPRSPAHFALSYYARFPSINPIGYPPFFYILEAIGYRLFGPSPFVGKAIVMGVLL